MIRLIITLLTVLSCIAAQELHNNTTTKLFRSHIQSYVTRLHPNQDIMQTLTAMLGHSRHNAVTVSSATGSVLHCYIRFANQSYLSRVEGPLEITSITGTFDRNLNPHLHIAVADGSGRAFGGHLPSLKERNNKENGVGFDCPIYTTLELVLLVHQDVTFERKTDPQTTYDELTIIPHMSPLRPRLHDSAYL